jgi:Tol biopolymer transport system component
MGGRRVSTAGLGQNRGLFTGESTVIVRGDQVPRRVPLGFNASGSLDWSPDGGRLAYASGGDYSALWLMRINDGSRTRLTGGGETSDLYPVWSPDGSTIYYGHGSYGDHDGLRMMAPDGTGDKMITTDDWGGGGASDGRPRGCPARRGFSAAVRV